MARKSRKQIPACNAEEKGMRIFQTAIYARLSVETEQEIEADTIGTQMKMLEEFAANAHDLKVYDMYCDRDETGTNFQRPEFTRMMHDIREGRVDCVLVKDLSRLGRNFLESGEYIEKVFPFFGVRFIAVNDGVDTLYRPADISVQLKNMVNEIYAKDVSQKIRSTMKSLQEQGKFIGSQPPYGYRRKAEDKYSLEIDPETAPIVQEMFRKISDGYTIHSIVLEFNERGIPSPGRYKYEKGLLKHEKYKNSVWFFSTMRKMLADATYLGWIQNGKYKSGFMQEQGKMIKMPREKWIIRKNAHEPIIEEALFWQVQEILEKKKSGSNVGKYASKGNRENIFRGKLRCGECGKSMALRRKKNGDKLQYWYICPMHEHYNSTYCIKKAVKKEQLESLILTLIQNQMQLFTDAKELLHDLNGKKAAQEKYRIYQNQMKSIEKQIEHFTMRKAELYSDFTEHLLSESDYQNIGREYSEKVEEFRIFLEELKKEAEKYSPVCGCSEKWEELVRKYQNQTEPDREMVEAFIESIVLYNDSRVEITFQYRDELEYILLLASERKREALRYA